MVRDRLHTARLQVRGRLFDVLARRGVDDRGQPRARERLVEQRELPGDRVRPVDKQPQVRTLEARDEHARRLEPEVADDVRTDPGRRGRREGRRRRRSEQGPQFADPQVVGAEVVAPLTHAVRLVHRQTDDVERRGDLGEVRAPDALRRDVEQTELAARAGPQARRLLVRVERTVDERRRVTAGRERIDLVLHQCDERAHDHGQPIQEQRRELVPDRLSAAGRHDRDDVLAREHGADDRLLAGAEALVAEVATERIAEVEGGVGLGHGRGP